MELIIISSPDWLENEAKCINALFAAGMHLFHLRKPNSSFFALQSLLDDIEPAYRALVVLHQHHELCKQYGLPRRHYPEAMRFQHAPAYFADLQQQGITLSTSIHRLDSISELMEFDYVFFSPVFDSISKRGYNSTLPVDFRLPERSASPRVIALGGVEAGNIHQIRAMNFDGIAVLGAMWNKDECPVEEFLRIQTKIEP
jgi:thiamine-phosphate pyrophosphorylase